ncbi:MAG: 2OG-Fe(II) oxygenase [Gammaproteobacteria bacterium]|nr:2OG-Fe(II) oxygenase [Gammaproteobacteria bacterium]
MSAAFPIDRVIVPLRTIREVRPHTFIFERPHALPDAFCDEVVRRFEAQPEYHRAGVIGQTGLQAEGIKKTTDLVVSDKDDWKFPYFKGPFKDLGYQVQRYREGEYYHWHIDGGSHQFSQRQLVVLWYLNDVPGPGGETEFLYQDVKVRPEKGKMVLFPPFWTHEHRAARVQKGAKYIATTWVVFA